MKSALTTIELRRPSGRSAFVVALAIASLLGASVPASAHDQPFPEKGAGLNGFNGWRLGEAVGYCPFASITSRSNYIKSAQAIMWADHDYWFSGGNSSSNVDGYWGGNSDRAMREYQYWNGLGVDGCGGAGTWRHMDTRFLRLIDICGETGIWLFRWQSYFPEYISYIGYSPSFFNLTQFQWFDGWRTVGHGYTGGGSSVGCY